MIRRNSQAGVVHSAALAFFVRARRAAVPIRPPRHATLAAIPHADRAAAPIHRLDCAAEDVPCRTKARRSFSGARQSTSVAPAPVKDFQSAPPTLRALDGDKSPLVWRADAPKNGWPAAPFRAVLVLRPRLRHYTGGRAMTPITHLYTVRACALIVRRPVKTKASRLWRALTGRHGHRYDAAHRARHRREESL
jgi:hypothetical protein